MDFLPVPVLNAPRCDSFFVEDAAIDRSIGLSMVVERPHLSAHDKEVRQMTIGWELSRLASQQYKTDILAHMQDMEIKTLPDVASIELQAEIQWFMRPYLLDFLIEAHAAFRLLPETLHLAINLLDRYCSKRVVYKRHYQLVGCAALFIAAKFGDTKEKVPTVRELKSMCCSLYDDEMFIQMEWHVLQTLDWFVGHPTLDAFLQIALTTEETADMELEHVARYLCEISLFHKEFVSVRPSVLARSAIALARCVLQRSSTNTSAWADVFDSTTILELSQKMRSPSQVLSHKYNSHQNSFASVIVEQFLERQMILSQRQAAATAAATAAAAAAAAAAAVTPSPAELRSNMTSQGYLTAAPQTPQKNRFTANVGILTPPITPEGEFFVSVVSRQCPMVPSQYPPTPTSESLARKSNMYMFGEGQAIPSIIYGDP